KFNIRIFFECYLTYKFSTEIKMTIKKVSSIAKLEELGRVRLSKSFLCVISCIAKSPIGTVYKTSPITLKKPSTQARNFASNYSNHYKKNSDGSRSAQLIAHRASINLVTKKE